MDSLKTPVDGEAAESEGREEDELETPVKTQTPLEQQTTNPESTFEAQGDDNDDDGDDEEQKSEEEDQTAGDGVKQKVGEAGNSLPKKRNSRGAGGGKGKQIYHPLGPQRLTKLAKVEEITEKMGKNSVIDVGEEGGGGDVIDERDGEDEGTAVEDSDGDSDGDRSPVEGANRNENGGVKCTDMEGDSDISPIESANGEEDVTTGDVGDVGDGKPTMGRKKENTNKRKTMLGNQNTNGHEGREVVNVVEEAVSLDSRDVSENELHAKIDAALEDEVEAKAVVKGDPVSVTPNERVQHGEDEHVDDDHGSADPPAHLEVDASLSDPAMNADIHDQASLETNVDAHDPGVSDAQELAKSNPDSIRQDGDQVQDNNTNAVHNNIGTESQHDPDAGGVNDADMQSATQGVAPVAQPDPQTAPPSSGDGIEITITEEPRPKSEDDGQGNQDPSRDGLMSDSGATVYEPAVEDLEGHDMGDQSTAQGQNGPAENGVGAVNGSGKPLDDAAKAPGEDEDDDADFHDAPLAESAASVV